MTITRRNLMAAAGSAGMLLLPARSIAAIPPATIAADDYGAKGDGRSDDSSAIARAIKACVDRGGGVVALSSGRTYLSGTVELKSNVFLYLAPGAVLKASPDRAAYDHRGALIFAYQAINTGVFGAGTIDGNYAAYNQPRPDGIGYASSYTFLGRWDPENPYSGASRPDGRPRVMLFVDCRRVALEQFRIVGAATWTIHLLGSRDVRVEGITISNELNVPNCDGIDIDHCRNVRIANCDINAGDDAICLKNSIMFPTMGPCEGITVTGCTLQSASSAIKLGSAANAPIRDVVATACTIIDSNRGLALQNRDGDTYENIRFSDMTIRTRYYAAEWWGAGEPIHISNVSRRRGQTSAGRVRNISFSDLTCESEAGALIYGAVASPIEHIVLQNVSIDIARRGREAGGFRDLRPSWEFPKAYPVRVAGVDATGVDGLYLRDVDVRFHQPVDAIYGRALETERVTRLDRERFTGNPAR